LSVLTKGIEDDPDQREANSRAIYEAVEAIIRQTERSREATMLLDTCISIDPSRMDDCAKLAWNRAVEYLEQATDAGYYLVDFLKRHDPQMLGRLRAGYGKLAKRYDEIVSVKEMLDLLQNNLEQHIRIAGSPPPDIEALQPTPAGMKPGVLRKGWQFRIEFENGNQKPHVVAEALPGNPAELPIGMRLSADVNGR
jgi:hypothetical protein